MHERRHSIVDIEGQGGSNEIDQLAGMEGDDDDDEDSSAKDAEILALARQRFQMSAEAEASMRAEMVIDQQFYSGNQWPDQIRSDRSSDKRPILTINRLPQFVKQITNPQRQSRPTIQVNPMSDGADVDTAEILQGIVRHIEHNSHADVAYDESYEDAVIMGRGWFRVLTEYVDDGSFEQDIVVRRIPNPLAVYPDPAAEELDYSDGRFLFIVEDVPKDEYRDLYGDASYASLELFAAAGNRAPNWYPEGRVRIAEYFYVEHVEREIALIESPEDGSLMTVPMSQVPKGVTPKRTRKVKDRVIKWIKMNAAEILERKTWPGRWIPVIPVLGDEVNVDGLRTLVGVVRYARDPQRMYNYWVTAETEAIALAPRAPFIGASGQFKGHETEWKLANTRNFPYLEYEMVDFGDKPAPPPQRQQFEPPIRAIADAVRQADNDLKAVIGFYDASLGQPGPDQSGKAILARQKQGETGNMNFLDNLTRALWHTGRIFIDLAPKIYDTKRVMHIMGDDDQRKRVVINNDDEAIAIKKIYDIRLGRYGVTVSTGPSYESKRQEAVASMLQLVKADPNVMPIIGDLVVSQMDWPMAKEIAARLKKALPPQLQEPEDGQPEVPPQVQAKIAQMTKAFMDLQKEYGKTKQALDADLPKIQSDERMKMMTLQSAERLQVTIQRMKDATSIEAARITSKKPTDEGKAGQEEVIALHLEQQHEATQSHLDRLHEAIQNELDRRHEAEQAALARQHATLTTAAGHEQEQTMAELNKPPEDAGSSSSAAA